MYLPLWAMLVSLRATYGLLTGHIFRFLQAGPDGSSLTELTITAYIVSIILGILEYM